MAIETAQAFEKLAVLSASQLSGDALRLRLAAFAREQLQEAIRDGSGSESYLRVVNGRIGAPEESVILPGPIVYRFSWLQNVAAYALAFLRERYPVRGPEKGGHYRDRHVLLVRQKPVALEQIRPGDVVTIVNTQPYARKVHVGSKGFAMPEGIYEDCRLSLRRHFGKNLLDVQMAFITLRDGYVLRGGAGGRRANSKAASTKEGVALLKKQNKYWKREKGPMTYPALILSMAD